MYVNMYDTYKYRFVQTLDREIKQIMILRRLKKLEMAGQNVELSLNGHACVHIYVR